MHDHTYCLDELIDKYIIYIKSNKNLEPKKYFFEREKTEKMSDEVKAEIKTEDDKNGNEKPTEEQPLGHGMAQGHFSSEIYKIEIGNIPKVVGYSELKKYLAKMKIKGCRD